jgi:hypothetical protein
VGDIRRFDVREKPVAYVGIDLSFENRDSGHDQTVFIWVHMLPEVTSRVSTISNTTCSERTAT